MVEYFIGKDELDNVKDDVYKINMDLMQGLYGHVYTDSSKQTKSSTNFTNDEYYLDVQTSPFGGKYVEFYCDLDDINGMEFTVILEFDDWNTAI